ncbi:EF-P beta-lysylation protein EpmB [Candidatus Albibeggiatoa sp. nov. NOAA]|uniref:EF-P beta-lysylation protein EpmB n=1 Tax=Candidatus Albibeggiatoa sp. nov. NOAA TaxID=3162724 RepID=UPI0032F72F30|nr:EF-P beta-lysylation protein EpmB [Thiotrichaceae bacterium]
MTSDWQQLLKQSIRNPQQLAQILELPQSVIDQIAQQPKFPVYVPPPYLNKIAKGDPSDPLLRQVLALKQEQIEVAQFTDDPVGDNAALKTQGVLHKYRGRVLLLATGACAIHCRYCFRQHFEYKGNTLADTEVIQYLASDTNIHEIILSGGDPLVLSDERLAAFIQTIEQIKHIKRLRIHSRLPIVLPERMTQTLLDCLTKADLQVVLVIHANHPNEIDEQVGEALQNLVKNGISVLNQTVLLKQVNDAADTLIQLSETLFKYQVLPYYLSVLDKVQGAAHFDVPEQQAIQLVNMLREQLPGYLVPKLVREVAGKPYKQPIY